MSESSTIDPLPILPETHPPDPLVQCGVLYLGSTPTNPALRGLDSIQEPFSRRYPIDGINKVRGIDSVLSIYNNGIQLAFIRQPHTVIFFPISSLIYCASVRFTIIENDRYRGSSSVDWRFMPLDEINHFDNKHPPLFCAVVRRTKILPGEECHCFITKSLDSAMALVNTISQIYSNNIQPGISHLKSPIFYQLDRYGRKLSEITGVIYISPANDNHLLLNRTRTNRLTDEAIAQNYLFDLSYDGFFYRTDASIIEQWQLWDDDDDIYQSRPRPPPSPFGLHEGLYHDDTTNEIQRYLRHMDEENSSCSSNSSTSSKSSCSTQSSTSTEFSQKQTQLRLTKSKSLEDRDQFNLSLSNLQTSSFEPVQSQPNIHIQNRPIIIEKILPKKLSTIPILHPQLPIQSVEPHPQTQVDYHVQPNSTSISYEINDRGEKITKEGNRIVFMDVVQLNTNLPPIESHCPKISTTHRRLHRHRIPKKIPIIDMETIERLFDEKTSKTHRRKKISTDHLLKEESKTIKNLTSPKRTEILDQYLPDYQHYSSKSSQRIDSSNQRKQQTHRKTSITSSIHSSKNENHRHQNHSTITTGQAINYVERPLPSSNQISSMITTTTTQQSSPFRPILTDTKLNEYISNIYGTSRTIQSMPSPSSSTTTTNRRTNRSSIDKTAIENPTYISAFRSMQNDFTRNIINEYRHAY